ncbi:VanZ family protein [Streptacidiphilus monticola]|uniref:VanZ family protein n=1 Tax=Streptacidiphilus monticola TaxID=2161674 RepID=A0ABW1G5K8_9ACTN
MLQTDRRGPAHGTARLVGLALVALHLGFVAWYATLPGDASFMADANLTPLVSIRQNLTDAGLPGLLEIARELLLLAPLGITLPLIGGQLDRPWLGSFVRTLLGGVLLATAAEALRTFSSAHLLNVDDVLLSVTGIALAHLAVVPAGRSYLRRLRDTPEADPETASPRSTGAARVRIVARGDAAARPAREA